MKLTLNQSVLFKFNSRKALLWSFLICFILYGNTLGHKYALDDAIVITKNEFVKDGFGGIKSILSGDSFLGFFGQKKDLVAGGRYRPLSLVTFAVEYQLFGETPWISHLVNILLYALIGWLLYLVVIHLLKNRLNEQQYNPIAVITSLIFLLHPIHTEVVANIKGRDELMALLFTLVSFYFGLLYFEKLKKRYLIWVIISMFLALMSKENAIAFVAIIPVAGWFFYKPQKTALFISSLSLILPAILFLIIRGAVIGQTSSQLPDELMNNPFLAATPMEKIATVLYTWFVYFKLLIFPHPLTYDYYPYHIRLVDFSNGWVLLLIASLLFLGIMFIKGLKSRSILSFCILGFFASFILVSNLLFPVGTFMNERFVFMPSVFWLLALVSVIYLWIDTSKKTLPGTLAIVLALYVFLFFPIKIIARNRAWANDFTLFTTDVKTSSNSAKSNCSAGGKLWEEAKQTPDKNKRDSYYAQSEVYLRKAVTIYPQYSDAWLLLGNLLFDYKKDIEGAAKCYYEVLKRQPANSNTWQNIDVVIPQSTNYAWAKDYYIKLLKIDSLQFKPNYRLGVICGRYLGDLKSGQYYLERANRIEPNNLDGLKDLGTVYGMTNQPQKAAVVFEKAIKIAPNDQQVCFNYGISLSQLGQKAKADSMFTVAKNLAKK